jgi:hypothetical protein
LPQDDDKSSAKDINDRLNGLVARSACYLKIGKNDLALQDSEESLKSNKEFTKVCPYLGFTYFSVDLGIISKSGSSLCNG